MASSLATTVRDFCARSGLKLNTNLGQHFLIDERVLEQILEAAKIEREDTVVEIGAGMGILTRELLKHAKRVIAIEIDQRWERLMYSYTGPSPHLELIHGNALRVPFPDEPYLVVANIPYHITSPLLRHAFLEAPRRPRSLTLLIQREVAEKICDSEGGILSITVKLFGTPRIITRVPPGAFLPPPKVDSAVLHIDCMQDPIANAETTEKILQLLKLAFGQKRKMLSNSIGKMPGGMEKLAAAQIDPTRRPQTVGVEEWVKLARECMSL